MDVRTEQSSAGTGTLTEKEQKEVDEVERALAELEAELEDFPTDSEDEGADESIVEAAALFPQHMPSVYNKGCALHAARDYEGARAAYEAALGCARKAEWRRCRAHALSNLGLLEHTVFRNASAAEALYRAALEEDAEHVHALTNCAVLLSKADKVSTRETVRVDVEGAEQLFRQALLAGPEHLPALVNFAYFQHTERGQEAEAEALYGKALRLDPNCTVALNNMAAFLCNEREPYDGETLMPVHFNTTCHLPDNFDLFTGLPIDPAVERPVDVARALYNRVLHINNPFTRRGARAEVGTGEGELLAHGVFLPSRAPPLAVAVDAEAAGASVARLEAQLAKATAALHAAPPAP